MNPTALSIMKTNNTRLNFSLLTNTITGLTLLSLTGGATLAANWTITDLGALGAPRPIGWESRAYHINNAGHVAGRGVVLVGGMPEQHYVMWSNRRWAISSSACTNHESQSSTQ